MKRLACSIGDHLRSQNFCSRTRKICTVVDTHQDIIGHDALVMSRIFPDHDEHGTFEGHEYEDVTVRSRIFPSPILFKEVTAMKSPWSLDDFLVAELPIIKRRITAL